MLVTRRELFAFHELRPNNEAPCGVEERTEAKLARIFPTTDPRLRSKLHSKHHATSILLGSRRETVAGLQEAKRCRFDAMQAVPYSVAQRRRIIARDRGYPGSWAVEQGYRRQRRAHGWCDGGST